MNVTKREFGETSKGEVGNIYTLENDKGMQVEITDFGGCVIGIVAPDRNGKPTDVVQGFSTLEEYEENKPYLSTIVGRNSNRIGNGKFTLNEVEYTLSKNSGKHNTHGGPNGLSHRLFKGESGYDNSSAWLKLTAHIPDMEDEFPGNFDVEVTYSLKSDNSLEIEYNAVSDKDTIINLTNHAYFNLAGHDYGSVLEHTLMLNAEHFNSHSGDMLLDGQVLSVKGTPFDFTQPATLASAVNADFLYSRLAEGMDCNFLPREIGFRKVATLASEESGIKMDTYTDQVGLQVYTSNSLNSKGKNGANYLPHSSVCLETQAIPNNINLPWFKSSIYKKGEKYHSVTRYAFYI